MYKNKMLRIDGEQTFFYFFFHSQPLRTKITDIFPRFEGYLQVCFGNGYVG